MRRCALSIPDELASQIDECLPIIEATPEFAYHRVTFPKALLYLLKHGIEVVYGGQTPPTDEDKEGALGL